MPTIEVILLSLALAADATAVCIAWSLCRPGEWRKGLALPVAFGAAQSGMAAIGLAAGALAVGVLNEAMSIAAVVVLALLGLNLLRPKRNDDPDCEKVASTAPTISTVLTLALATSCDAAAAGVTLSTLTDDPALALIPIGVITLVLSLLGLRLGAALGSRAGKAGERIGGVVLLGLAIKIGIETAWG